MCCYGDQGDFDYRRAKERETQKDTGGREDENSVERKEKLVRIQETKEEKKLFSNIYNL